MSSARQVKQRITSARNISKITKAMEMVSASKMRRAQDRALAARGYSQALKESLVSLAQDIDPSLHALLRANQSGEPIAVVISTDRGLCGNLNQSLFKALILWKKNYPTGEVIAVGKKAIAFCHFYAFPIHAQFSELPDAVSTSDIVGLSKMLIDGYLDSTFRSVDIFFMDFINTLSQRMKKQRILPIADDFADDSSLVKKTNHAQYQFEPSAQEILSELLPYYLENVIYQSFLEGRASEHSARMVTMKNASENAGELVTELQLVFNKQRQASITNELLDITTAQLSLKT